MTRSATDRRGARRVPANSQVTVRHMRRQLPGTARDISSGGIFLFTEERLQPGSDMELVLWIDRKSTRLNSSHIQKSRMPSSA